MRTRVGQPTAQDMPGTRKATSDGAPAPRASGLLLVLDGSDLNIPKTERNRLRIGSFSLGAILNYLAFQSLLSDGFEHHLGRDLGLVVGDVDKVTFQVDIKRRNTRKP